MKAKSQKSSMSSRVEMRSVAAINLRRAPEPSASELADSFCRGMIQNLAHNVAEAKKKARLAAQL